MLHIHIYQRCSTNETLPIGFVDVKNKLTETILNVETI